MSTRRQQGPLARIRRLRANGYTFTFERDATTGWEYVVVAPNGRTLARGWTAGTKRDAQSEALADLEERRQ